MTTATPAVTSLERLPTDWHETLLLHLDAQSARTLSTTCTYFHLLTQEEVNQLQLLMSYFPLFRPLRDANGALTVLSFSILPKAHCSSF